MSLAAFWTHRTRRLALAAATFGTALALSASVNHGVEIAPSDGEGGAPSLLSVREASAPADAPIALLVHGGQCNSGMMMQLAKFLAASGVHAYVVDLPGHGRSTERFTVEDARDSVRDAVEQVTRGADPNRVVLIGHSFGARVLVQAALDPERYGAAVFLGPAYDGRSSPRFPRNLLVVTAEHEPPPILQSARAMLRDATAGAITGPGQESGSAGTARRWASIAGSGHVSLLFRADASGEVLQWIERSTGWHAPRRASSSTAFRAGLAALLAVGSVALALAAARGTSNHVLESPQRLPAPPLVRSALTAGYSLAIAVVALRFGNPLAVLHLAEGERIAGLLSIAGFTFAALDITLCRAAHLRAASPTCHGLVVAATAVAALYLVAQSFVTPELYHLAFHWTQPRRLFVAVLLAPALYPFFAMCEGLGGRIRGRGLALAYAVGLCAVVSGSLYVIGPALLARFAGTVFALGASCAAFGVLLRRAAGRCAAAAFGAMLSAWTIAVGFFVY
jgi:pimeloyl-ACP methyl ester carboxylesterase